MTRPRTIDIHTHILTEETIGLLAKEAPWVAPKLTPIDNDFAVLEVAGTPYRPFPRGGWELERRFADMDAMCTSSRRRRRPISTTRTPP